MRKHGRNLNYIFDVVFKNAPGRPRRTLKSYQRFLREIVPGAPTKVETGVPKKLSLADKTRLLEELRNVVSRGSARPNVILFELSGADYHDFDDFTAAILGVMKGHDKHFPKWIVFVIGKEDSEDVRKSVVTQKLVSLLAKRNVGLLVNVQGDENGSFILSGSWQNSTPLPRLENPTAAKLDTDDIVPLTNEEIVAGCQILYGHFAPVVNPSLHIPVLLSLNRLSKDLRFQAALKAAFRDLRLPNAPIIFAPLLESTGLEVAAYALERTIILPSDLATYGGRPCIVLTDLLVTNDQLDGLQSQLNERGGSIGAVVAIAKYRSVRSNASRQEIAFANLDYSAEAEQCRFCLQDSVPLSVKNLPEVQEKLGKFDPVVFWELVRSDPAFYRVGHESIPRTGYHYHFRIFAKPLFRHHSFGLAMRIRNAAESTGVYPEWIGKIVCADDPELRSFAGEVAEVFGLSDKDVVALPRADFRRVAGKRIDKPLRDHFKNTGAKALARQNVLIVDQAAHHFKTVAALASVCAEFDSKVLGFAVVVDRVAPEVRLSGHLPFSHYIPLYVWPCAPGLRHECACQRSENT